MSISLVLILALLFVLPAVSYGQEKSDCSKLVKLVKTVYGFKPSQLTSEQQTSKSKEMDGVWDLVKSNKPLYVPCLKSEIAKSGADKFFRFDAANLLFQLDQGDESKKRIARIYGEVPLSEVNLEFWMRYLAPLGFQGYDTSAAGDNWLRTKEPKYFLPAPQTQPVDKLVGAYIIFGSMKEELAVPKLIEISREKDHPGRSIAVEMLAQIQTDEALKAFVGLMNAQAAEDSELLMGALKTLKQIAPRKGTPKHSREQFLAAFNDLAAGKAGKFAKMVSEAPDGEKDAVAVLKKSDVPLIRRARRYFALMSNPQTPAYYRVFSSIIAAVNKKPL